MNNLNLKDCYKNLKVLVTGSTGVKGSWLCNWLNKFGSKVVGVGLKPEKESVLFKALSLDKKISQHFINIEDFIKIDSLIKKEKPDIIFHLAAQSIVSESFLNPIGTIKTNTLGSTNILESVKKNKIKNLVFITSDKCYLNLNTSKPYKEKDLLGGHDIYSSSKAAAEILFHSYHDSFFILQAKNLKKVTARAGNVIGGGDFKINRVIPDFFRSVFKKKKLVIRNPLATRPWQHVLEPLSGYLILGEKILNNKLKNNLYPSWNFGPHKKNCKKVREIIDSFYGELRLHKNYNIKKNSRLKEAQLLSLDISKAKKELNWEPRLSLDECIVLTSNWYINYISGESSERVTEEQIEFYENK